MWIILILVLTSGEVVKGTHDYGDAHACVESAKFYIQLDIVDSAYCIWEARP